MGNILDPVSVLGVKKMLEMNFEEKSFKNMVGFWSEELIKIMKGKSAKKIFPMKKRVNLVGKGILVVKTLLVLSCGMLNIMVVHVSNCFVKSHV